MPRCSNSGSGAAQILVATTVIEVGVDVPEATIMVIEDAERFGISQLHQLRGRVGRGSDRSYCVLFAGWNNELSDDARQRLEAICATTDGFALPKRTWKCEVPVSFSVGASRVRQT
jgi:ATP-dependent DNA helicase RecG